MFEALGRIARKVFGDANEREIKRIQPAVVRVNALEPAMKALSDEDLARKTVEFKERVANGQSLDDLLPEAFAVCREGAVRSLGMRHYDCQLIGGAVLHHGKISEMKTGEGKTLVATLAVYLNALEGKGVHVVTVNDYLANRDAEWMGRLYNYLGLSVGKILSNERSDKIKRDAYAADVTYGTNNEFGFDYLRDNMKYRLEDYVQRGHRYGIVDEVDSILVDEARTPLIISGPADADVNLYYLVDTLIPLLQDQADFTLDEKGKNVTLTDDGVHKLEQKLGIDNLFDPHNMETLHHVNQSLKAHHLFKRDKDYVVRDGKVTIVDEFTGRLMQGRRWSDGLHQAVEAKEKVTVENESQTYATITFQNYFRMYDKLAGMTGTAETEAAEFASIYDLDTVVIPTNRPVSRKDAEDIVYKTQMEKFRAVMLELKDCHQRGQPVLVGTTSVEKSEIVAKLLAREGIPHNVLNAKNHANEAHIVAQAGRKGAITISTNMAGRGTDIVLGGNPVELAKDEVGPSPDPEKFAEAVARFKALCAGEQKEVLAAGGLHIIGTERHESRRIDNQLRGRSGRQGDPGSSRFYLSLEDDLMRIFGSDKITVWMERMGLKDDEPIEHRWITRAIENAQKKVEGHNFQMRKNLLEYDDVMNYQRKGVYELRRRALAGENITDMMRESVENVVFDIVDEDIGELHPELWRVDAVRKRVKEIFGIEWEESDKELRDHSKEELRRRIHDEATARLDETIEAMGKEAFEQVSRMLVLQFADQLWKDHLLAVDRLRQGVGLRGYGQRNPLLEYKREAFNMYLMMSALRDEAVLQKVFRADAATANAAAGAPSKAMARRLAEGGASGLPGLAGGAVAAGAIPGLPNLPEQPVFPVARPAARPRPGAEAREFALANGIGRNDPCPCGSGKKHKKCCGADAGESIQA